MFISVRVCLGVIPGVFEELFFRGYLLGALRHSIRHWLPILICGIIFGMFHVIAAEGATLERLLPSASLGCLLSWIAIRTNSVLPGMVMHVIHNSSLLIIAHFRDELSNIAVGSTQQEHLPGSWLIASAVTIILGVTVVACLTRADPATAERLPEPELPQSALPGDS